MIKIDTQKLKRIMINKNLNQSDLAKKLNVSRQAIYKLTNVKKKIKTIRLETANRLISNLDCKIEDLEYLEEEICS